MGHKRSSKSQRKVKSQQKLRSAPSSNYKIDFNAVFFKSTPQKPSARKPDDHEPPQQNAPQQKHSVELKKRKPKSDTYISEELKDSSRVQSSGFDDMDSLPPVIDTDIGFQYEPSDPNDPNALILLPKQKKTKKDAYGLSMSRSNKFGPISNDKKRRNVQEAGGSLKKKAEKEKLRVEAQHVKRKERTQLLNEVAQTNLKGDEGWMNLLQPSTNLGRKGSVTKREKLEKELLEEKLKSTDDQARVDQKLRFGTLNTTFLSDSSPSSSESESEKQLVQMLDQSVPVTESPTQEKDDQVDESLSEQEPENIYEPVQIIPNHNIVVQDQESQVKTMDANRATDLYNSVKINPQNIKRSVRVRKPRTLKVSRKVAEGMLNKREAVQESFEDESLSEDSLDEDEDEDRDGKGSDGSGEILSSENELSSDSDASQHSSEESEQDGHLESNQIAPGDEYDFLKKPLVVQNPIVYKKHIVTVHRKHHIQKLRSRLPIYSKEQEIMEAINEHDVVIVTGSTGSGKTTQIPQFLYEAKYGDPNNSDHTMTGMVAVCEPRRVAAISCASRVAEELNTKLGSVVGYQIRHDAQVQKHTRIKFATDGILLREIESDFLLKNYSAIVIDEAHERTLNTDLLLALLSRTIQLRREDFDKANDRKDSIGPLKLIIMSATLEIDGLFKGDDSLFGKLNTPVIHAESRLFPVTVHFSKETKHDYFTCAFKKVCKIHKKLPPGGILVFLTGKLEVETMCKQLRKKYKGKSGRQRVNVYPLYSNMSDSVQSSMLFEDLSKEKDKKGRKIVIATNVAETSITIPDIVYIVDSGRAKERVFEGPVSSFQIKWITQASAEQRAGRAGRTAAGHCYRLYSSSIYQEFQKFQDPEILRTPVDTVVLRLRALGITEIDKFPFPSKPDSTALKEADVLLKQLGLIESETGRLTKTGIALSTLPVSPRIGKLLLIGRSYSCSRYCTRVAGVISSPEIFRYSYEDPEKAKIAAKAHSLFSHPHSDILAKFRAISAAEFSSRGDSTRLSKFCEENFLVEKSVKEALDVAQQLEDLLRRWGLSNTEGTDGQNLLKPPNEDQEISIRKAILAGYPDQVARRSIDGKKMQNWFTTPLIPEEKLFVHNLSALRRSHDFEYFVFTDVIKSSNKSNVAQGATVINKEWISKLASGVCTFSALKGAVPRYDESADKLLCNMRITYGSQKWPLGSEETTFRIGDAERKNLLQFRCFAKAFLDGKVCKGFSPFVALLCASSKSVLTEWGQPRVAALVGSLARENIASKASLGAKWKKSKKFLLSEIGMWLKDPQHRETLRHVWEDMVDEVVNSTKQQIDFETNYLGSNGEDE